MNRNGVPTHTDLLTGAVMPRRERRSKRLPTVEERRAQRVVRSRQEELREVCALITLADAACAKASAHLEALGGRAERRRADAEEAERRAADLRDAIAVAPDSVTAATEAARAQDAARAARARSDARAEEVALASGELGRLEVERSQLARKADGIRALIGAEAREQVPAVVVDRGSAKGAELEAKGAELEAKAAELEAKAAELEAREQVPAVVVDRLHRLAILARQKLVTEALWKPPRERLRGSAKGAELEAKAAELEAKAAELEAKAAELEAKAAEQAAALAELEAKAAKQAAALAELEAKAATDTASAAEGRGPPT